MSWFQKRASELARVPVLVTRVLPAVRRAKASGTAPWLAWLEAHAQNNPEGLFCELDQERVSFGQAWARIRTLAALLAQRSVERGDVVALIGGNSPSYLLLLLAISYSGAAAALLNPELSGEPLAHALGTVKPRLTLVEVTYRAAVDALGSGVAGAVLAFGDGEVEALAERVAPLAESRADPEADFVLIFTSGTTGLPKPCRVRHSRARSAATIFGSVAFEFRAGDKLYCALPLHHSSALLIGVGAALVAGVPVALRRKFSAREFETDLVRYGATATLYIGDVCRAVLRAAAAPPLPSELRLRVAVGNGLEPEIWLDFQRRLGGPKIHEFYASTEAPSAILNLTGKVGSLGHVPFERSRGFRLAKLNAERGELRRAANGRVEACAVDEPGELLLRVFPSARDPLGAFAGYTDDVASRARIARDVFEVGDAYFRSGDVLRRDRDGYFYFVDRLGDGYRWKGENVSALQVERALSAGLGRAAVAVFGVSVPGYPGRAGFAEVVSDGAFDPQRFAEAASALPSHARPCFVRPVPSLELTSSFKIKKRALDLATVARSESLWVRQAGRYVVLTLELWDDLCRGQARL